MVIANLGRQRAVLSLTTRFCLPHEGMTELEYLSRGSAFVLDSAAMANTASTNQLHNLKILTCQHVACPWLFPNYFQEKWDWLQHVSEEFVQHSLQLLEMPSDDGDVAAKTFRPKVLVDIPLMQQVWLHPERDLAMLAINEDDELKWNEVMAKWHLHALPLNPVGSTPGDLLLFTGHRQLPDAASEEEFTESTASNSSDDEDDDASVDSVGQYPKQVHGRFVGQSSRGQAFAWSEEILEEGMCGGAVVDAHGNCVGLIEGIVPRYDPSTARENAALSSDASEEERDAATAAAATARMQKALENHVAYVPSIEINEFLQDSATHTVLTGIGLL